MVALVSTTIGTDRATDLKNKAVAKLSKLPPFSPILNKLMASLADEGVSFSEIGGLIEKDTVLAGNVLRLVNSALYARRGTINSVRHAVSLLGLEKIRNAVMSMSLNRLWKSQTWPAGWIPSQFNLHSVAAAILSDLLAAELDSEYPEGAFAAGLLQNLGMLLIASSLPGELARVRHLHQTSQVKLPLVECEHQILGFDHAELSQEVLKSWNLPDPIQIAVGEHHRGAPGSLAYAVGLADQTVERMGIMCQAWHRRPSGEPKEWLDHAGLGARADALLAMFEDEYGILKSFF
jgi:HD-like signal output (HDOD) protein